MVVEVMLGVAHHERVSVAEISVDHLPPLWNFDQKRPKPTFSNAKEGVGFVRNLKVLLKI
jgi:hypothetical protein